MQLTGGEVRFIDSFFSVGIGATAAVFILVAFSMLAGYLLGGPEKHNRQVLATSSANRNLGVSLLVGASALTGHGGGVSYHHRLCNRPDAGIRSDRREVGGAEGETGRETETKRAGRGGMRLHNKLFSFLNWFASKNINFPT
ncbi:hypothetical protein [Methanogenium cariaci]|uniref:hypothetical protein n=1 Tax=Methanogenium cariaci TaxID=2197 RepID=UPI0007822329|nr:hypothetical protein [Methanogenium cariaci]